MSETVEVVEGAETARGTIYGTLAHLYEEPSRELYETLASGSLFVEFERLIDRTALSVAVPTVRTEDEYELLCARFNDLFVVGAEEPPVPRHETEHVDRSWNDTNLELARAYDYFDLEIDESNRDHHDFLVYELEFAGYLARLGSLGENGAKQARLDFLDRHLIPFLDGMAEAIDAEPGTEIYGAVVAFSRDFARADKDALEAEVGTE